MTGYYQFSQALSAAMPESSSAITISGVEPLLSFAQVNIDKSSSVMYNPGSRWGVAKR